MRLVIYASYMLVRYVLVMCIIVLYPAISCFFFLLYQTLHCFNFVCIVICLLMKLLTV